MTGRRDGAEEGRATRALVVAFVAHALVVATLWRTARVPAPPNVPELVAIELAIERAEPEALPRVDRARAPEETRAIGPASHVPAVVAGSRAAQAGAVVEAPAEASVLTSPRVDDGDGWSIGVAHVDVGFDAVGRATLAGQAATREAADRRLSGLPHTSTTGGVAEALDAHDVELGLGRGGLVRSMVEAAVEDSSVMGRGTFQVRIDSRGNVSVGLEGASSDAQGWGRLAEAIRKSVVGHKGELRFAPGSDGMSVTVAADAREQFPDGRDPKSLGNKIVAVPGAIKETEGKIDITLPAANFVHTGKVCTVALHVGLDGPGVVGGCSPENIGSVARRVVAARVVSESRL